MNFWYLNAHFAGNIRAISSVEFEKMQGFNLLFSVYTSLQMCF